MDMKYINTHDTSTSVFLTASVVLANLDYSSLTEYAVKATIGGIIWIGFKLAGDWIARKFNRRSK